GKDRDAETVADEAQILDRGIDAPARLRDALNFVDRRSALEILQFDLDFLVAVVFDFTEIADVALILQNLQHAHAQRRRRRSELRAAAHLRVADAGNEIADGIVQIHDRPLTSST